jgi:hypothetical protein
MANILSKTGITTNSTIRTWHVTQSIDAFNKTQAYDITLSGSLTVTGSLLPNSSITGTLITSASYTITSSFSSTILSASNSLYANVAPDTLVIQLHHGIVDIPVANTIYYFAINPITGSTGGTLPTASGRTGIYPPSSTITVLSASLSTTVNGTLATNESSSYNLFIGATSYPLNPFNHSSSFTSSITTIGSSIWPSDSAMYVFWRTPTSWSTPATKLSHNLVLYCTRNTSSL